MNSENISLFVAFLAGLVSFLSPCVLPLVPAYLGHLLGVTAGVSGAASLTQEMVSLGNNETGNPGQSQGFSSVRMQALSHALMFVSGFSLVFVTFWASLNAIGQFLPGYIRYVRPVGGIILIILGLNMAGVFRLKLLYRTFKWDRKVTGQTQPRPPAQPGLPASFFTGVLFAAGWTPCIGPILGGIIGLASESTTALQGTYLLVAYSLGLGVPFILCALALGQANALLRGLNRKLNSTRLISVISGLFVTVVGFLMLTNTFQAMSVYFNWLVFL